ncbi:hypothetical protein [Nocardia panacis]|uniref:hypothetical protein n=1 Tax=Nocardia panacis TaxID=2340916 RepID=UPI0013152CDC|nr:hypothetical protein [Nocardia panacis]
MAFTVVYDANVLYPSAFQSRHRCFVADELLPPVELESRKTADELSLLTEKMSLY